MIAAQSWAADVPPSKPHTVGIILDTDIGNDVDDVLALSMLHALQTRGDCELLGVTITKPDELAGPFVDAMNTFYGRPGIPIGFTRASLTNAPSKFLFLADAKDGGTVRYPHALARSSDAPAATQVLRTILSHRADGSVVLVQVGYFSNLAALLDTPGDALSPLTGRELINQKVRFLSVMAGSFQPIRHSEHFLEFNVTSDIPSAQKLARDWPTPIVWSGFEIGIAVPYPAASMSGISIMCRIIPRLRLTAYITHRRMNGPHGTSPARSTPYFPTVVISTFHHPPGHRGKGRFHAFHPRSRWARSLPDGE